MATISLTGFDLNTLTFNVCANQQVAWSCVKLDAYTNTYVNNTVRPIVSGLSTSTTCSSYGFEWYTLNACSTALSISATTDTATVALCAYLPSTPTNYKIYEFNPKHLYIQQTRLSDNTLSATAYYQQVSTNNLTPINDTYDIIWNTTPYTTTLSTVLPTVNTFSDNIIGVASTLSSILLSSNVVGSNSFQLNLSSPNALSIYNTTVFINSPINIETPVISTTFIELSATQYSSPLSIDKQLIWNIIPYTGSEYLSVNGVSALSFGTQYSALYADYVTISSRDLTQSYLYTLSSYIGLASGTFRPYLNLSPTTTLSASVSTISDNKQEHQYLVDIHGITNNVKHNLDLSEFLVYRNTTNDAGIYVKKLNNFTYPFDFIDTVQNVEKLNLYISPSNTTTYPRVCTYSFTVCALSGANESEVLATTAFNIQMQEWLDTSIFNPAFTIQYEPITLNTIYRPVTSASYRITNDSILPPSSVGNLIYTFNDVVSTIPFNTIIGTAPTEFYHTFNALTPCVCTVNLTVQTSGANYTSYTTRDAIGKTIVFTNFPVATGVIMYPEFVWTGSNWGEVVHSSGTNSGEILSANVGLSAYSFCHTENFFVSSNDTLATSYVWNVQNALDNSGKTITTVLSPTGWLALPSPKGTAVYSVCASLFTADLPSTMPSTYYDHINGTRYPNFSTTFDTATSDHYQHIKYFGVESTGLLPNIVEVQKTPMGIPSNLYLTGGYTFDGDITNNTPFSFYMGAFSFLLSSNYFQTEVNASLVGDTATTKAYINVDDIGDGYLSLPKYDVNNVDIIPIIGITPQLKVSHPSAATWCFANTPVSSYANKESITVYPVMPLIYTPNRYVLTGTNVNFENLVNCFEGIQDFVWNDRGEDLTVSTCVPYNTSFYNQGTEDITLTTHFSAVEGVVELINEFANVVNVDPAYNDYNSNINRVYGVTQLELPHDFEDVSIGSNDFLVADTFNASMTKIYDNLTYIQYMAQLYDVPPTEHCGWVGTSNYSNGSKHFRWYVNSPNITYGYNRPDLAVDDVLNNVKDVCVRDNMMYVSNGTSVTVLSSDFRATQLGSIDFKTIGDYFTNIKAIKLDSENRIYLLDTFDVNNPTNGSKNRVIVFNYDTANNAWMLLHSWGNLGGPNARTKFNNPNDLYVDVLDNVWVTDTGNKVIKQFTRTGSWLQTITSELFTNDPPLSVTVDENNYVQVLTSSNVIQFSNAGVYMSTKKLNFSGAKTIRPCSDAGFAYICYTDKIVKYMYTEGTQAVFAKGEFTDYTENYQNVYHDEYRNLYVAGTNHILKYVDKLFTISLKQDTTSKLWPLSSLFVNKNEYIQDWVVNRGLNRMWDNVEVVRKSLLGKFDYRTVKSVTTVTVLSTIPAPSTDDFYCTYDFFYGNGRYVTTDIVFEYLKPDVRTFTTDEYKPLPYTKDNIYIGINELVTAPVLNRPFKKLFDCESTILDLIT